MRAVTSRSDCRAEGVGPRAAADLRGLLDAACAEMGLAPKLLEGRALLAWEEVAGPALAAQARAIRVHRGRLEVAVPSAVWRAHLSFVRLELVERLNRNLGQPAVRELVLVNQR